MSNRTFTEINEPAKAALALPCRAETATENNDKEKTAELPVPITADFPIPSEFRRWHVASTLAPIAECIIFKLNTTSSLGGS